MKQPSGPLMASFRYSQLNSKQAQKVNRNIKVHTGTHVLLNHLK